jgi:hypothetical protein
MKYLLIVLVLLNQICLLGQVDFYDLEETFWLNKKNEYLHFGKIGELGTTVNLNDILNDEFIEFDMISDTIAFRALNEYFLNEENPGYTTKLTVAEKTDSTLFLNVVLDRENQTGQNKIVKLYKSIANQNINQFRLKSISLIRSGESILIDSIGNVNVKKGWANDIPMKYNDQSEFGSYTGKLSDAQLYDLKYSLLRTGIFEEANLDNYRICSHCQEVTLMIEYDNELLKCTYNWAKPVLFPFLKEIRNVCNLENLNRVK